MVQDIKGPLIVCLVINRRIILTIGIYSVLHQLNPNLKLTRVKDCIESVIINDLVLNCDGDEGCQICHVVLVCYDCFPWLAVHLIDRASKLQCIAE